MVLKDDPKAYTIMGCAMRVHSILGCGFLESAYGDALEIEFKKAGISYVREDNVRIYYDGQPLPTNWRADFTCFDRSYIVELNFGRPQLQYDTFDLAKLPSGSVIETAYSPPQGAAKRLSTMGAAQQITETPSLTVESESSSRSTDNSAER